MKRLYKSQKFFNVFSPNSIAIGRSPRFAIAILRKCPNKGAVKEIGTIIGRKLDNDELKELHENITGEGLGFWEIVDERKDIESVVHSLGGLALQKILIYPEKKQFDFAFELDYILKVYSSENRSEDEELWMLFCPNDYVLTMKDSGNWTYRPSSEA
ncbi:MAG: hypothetical protein ACRDBG_05875, partial [Waterburya sp.]